MKLISAKQSLQCAWQNLTHSPLERCFINRSDKTTAISFHFKQIRLPSRPHVIFKNIGIIYKSKLRFLGIFITENIQWEAQVQSLSSKVSKISYIIKSLKEIMSPYTIWSILLYEFSVMSEVCNFMGWRW